MAEPAIEDWCPCDTPCSLQSEQAQAADADRQCSQHACYPAGILSKIDFSSDMSTSVKAHSKHVLLCAGSDPARWPEEVTSTAGSFSAEFEAALGRAKAAGALTVKVRASLSDSASLDAHGQLSVRHSDADSADPHEALDLLLFPDQIRIHAVRKDQLDEFVTALGEFCKQQQKNKASTAAAADSAASSATASRASLTFPLLHSALPGTHYLICSHKQRDKRCGVSGPLLCAEFDRSIALSYPSDPLPSPIHCHQISHIGGHAYAGNVIAYPSGTWYGRVMPCHVPHLLMAHSPGFAMLDASSGERRVMDEASRQRELAKLKPLVRGRVDS